MNAQEKTVLKETQDLLKVLVEKLPGKEIFKGFSTWLLLISNLLIAFFTIIENQSVLNVLWVYWFQSVTIGVLNFFKIISLKEFNADGLKINDKPVKKTSSAKIGIAVFFLIHYGFFHFVYAMFLFSFVSMGSISYGAVDVTFVLLTSLIFFVNYIIEFIFTFRREQSKVQSLPKLMMAPYKRIIPMHLTIILSGFVMAGGAFGAIDTNIIILLIFIGLKTTVDLITHSD